MLEKFKPLLAINYDDVTVKPQHMTVSPKLDGIRATCFGGVLYSRSLKPIPNLFIQAWAKANEDILEGFDGELIVGDPTAKDVFQKTTSGVMSIKGEPDFSYYVFDLINEETLSLGYDDRHNALSSFVDVFAKPRLELVPAVAVDSEEELLEYESEMLALGYEGIMVRDAMSKYKFGRSGKKNPEIMKVKRFVDEEFEVIGFECEYENKNEATINELGRTERSTSRAGMVPKDSLGTLLLRCSKTKKVFNCGGGFTKAQREEFWQVKESLIGKLAKVKYFNIGIVDVPRFPVWIGFRSPEDM